MQLYFVVPAALTFVGAFAFYTLLMDNPSSNHREILLFICVDIFLIIYSTIIYSRASRAAFYGTARPIIVLGSLLLVTPKDANKTFKAYIQDL